MMGVTPTEYAAFAQEIGLDLIGSNCGIGPAELMDSTGTAECGLRLARYRKGNCGILSMSTVRFPWQPRAYGALRTARAGRGVTVIGGCRGTTPEHLAAMVEALNSTPQGLSMVRQWRSSWASRGQICLAVVVKAVASVSTTPRLS